jgi:deaminated glutathione amidase
VLGQQAEGEGVVVGVLDAERLRAVRQQLPALTHRVL